jgi:hypothetical protein
MQMNPEFILRRLTRYEFELHTDVAQNHPTSSMAPQPTTVVADEI